MGLGSGLELGFKNVCPLLQEEPLGLGLQSSGENHLGPPPKFGPGLSKIRVLSPIP